METKNEFSALLKRHLQPPEGLPPLHEQARARVAARKRTSVPKGDVFFRLALVLNGHVKLSHAAVLGAVVAFGVMLFLRSQPVAAAADVGVDSNFASLRHYSSVNSSTVLSSICTSRFTKKPYDGNPSN